MKEQRNEKSFLFYPVLCNRKDSILELEGEPVIQQEKLSPRRKTDDLESDNTFLVD